MEVNLFNVVNLCVLTAVAFGADGQTNLFRVILHVFSGTPDPEWYIHPSNKNFERILNSVNSNQSTNLGSQLGYNGFTIDVFKDSVYSRSVNVGRCTRTEFEMLLLDAVKDLTPEGSSEKLGTPVIEYVSQQIRLC